MKKPSANQILFFIFLVLFIATVARGFWVLYVTKNYDYLVEASCDPRTERCFERECTNPDDCPPNQLTHYKQYYVKAKNFGSCSDNSCSNICVNRPTMCVPVPCAADAGDTCSGPTQQ